MSELYWAAMRLMGELFFWATRWDGNERGESFSEGSERFLSHLQRDIWGAWEKNTVGGAWEGFHIRECWERRVGSQPTLCLKGAFQVCLFVTSLFLISTWINSHFQLFFWVFGLLIGMDTIGHSFVLWDSRYACSVSDLFWMFFISLENIGCSVPSHNLMYQIHAFISSRFYFLLAPW